MTVDDILKPYEDDQPNNLNVESKIIQRMPRLVDATGKINSEFQKFYETIVKVLCNSSNTLDGDLLYNVSNTSMRKEQLYTRFKSWLETCEYFSHNNDDATCGIDIELNIDRFRNTHRNIVGSFYISTYVIKTKTDDITDKVSESLILQRAEIFFTYKKAQGFRLLPVFEPFIIVED